MTPLPAPLIVKPAEKWPEPAPWLTEANSTALQRRIVHRALRDDGVLEQPLGSNRSPYLDGLCRWAGIPLGSWWCALWVGKVYADAGCQLPRQFPSCDAWLPFAVPVDSVPPKERVGCAILYGVPGDARHIGIVARVPASGPMLTIEGNRAYLGSASNNGVAVDLAPTMRRDVLGLVRPIPVADLLLGE
jgi:hypothetical protein